MAQSLPPHQAMSDEISAEWREFIAGMEFLHRYGTHNTANARAIGRDNLRLLHRSLLQKADYQQAIHHAGQQVRQQSLPNKTTLIVSHQLSAQLISLPVGSSIQLVARAREQAMFMIINGSANTANPAASHHQSHWWSPKWLLGQSTATPSLTLKTNDIICIPQGQPNPCVLSAQKKHCIILAVFNAQTPMQSTPLPQQQPRPGTSVSAMTPLVHHSSL